MELGDFEPATEFEFDLSDVDVAAFESVATEDTTNPTQEQQLPPQLHHQSPQSIKTLQSPTTDSQQIQHHHQQQQPPQPPPPKQSPQQQPPQPQHQQQHHVTQLASATGTQGRILLVPINSKPGTPGLKHLTFQLPAGASPITMGAQTISGSTKPILQLAPLSTSSLNMSKNNNYPFPITTTSQILPGSSQGHKQQHLYYATTATTNNSNNSSPAKHQQTLSLNSVLNKTLSNLQQNNSSISSQFSNANLSSSGRNVSYNDSLRAPTPYSSAANEVPKRKPCNCTKSQCLKLYCDCFANGEFCSGCNCTNCFNSLSKEKERQKAISQCLERNPEAFRPKIGKAVKMSIGEPTSDSIERRHTKGCNCKRSGCLKNYCECYEAKILCSNLCKCCGCKNYEESFERKSLMQLANSASENSRGILKNLLPTNNNFNTGKEFTKCLITDKVIHASLQCLLHSAQQAEKDGTLDGDLPNLVMAEMGKCLRMIVDSATETSSPKKR